MSILKEKVSIRFQKVADAQRFFEILRHKNFIYWNAKPKSLQDEIKWLKKNPEKRKQNIEYNFTFLLGKKVVGGGGIKINQHRNYIGEIGYFVDFNYWGRGIASQATRLMEQFAFKKLKLKRIEILMMPQNKASEKIAIKCKYKKEGRLRKYLQKKDKLKDCYLYAKTR